MTQIEGQQKHHGRDAYYMVDEGAFRTSEGPVSLRALQRFSREYAMRAGDDPTPYNSNAPFRFGRMFTERKEQPCEDALNILGQAMYQVTVKESSKTPAGYTFLGQFISHDMSFDDQGRIFPGPGVPATYKSRKSPDLDLDSLYGRLYSESGEVKFDEKLYEPGGTLFKLGLTELANPVSRIPNDLPREDAVYIARRGGPIKFRRAILGDSRNDENLGLAQTVVSFLRFHNAVVEFLRREGKTPDEKLFDKSRRIVIKHYQWIILEDFLPEIIDTDVLNEVKKWAREDDPRLDWTGSEDLFMPVEFAAAAFRLGHSMLQSQYEWNRFFETPDPGDSGTLKHTATFADLFKFTGSPYGGLEGATQLPGNWMIDWRRFYNFSRYGIEPHPKSNSAGLIDPILINNLRLIFEFYGETGLSPNLAVRNLQRGKTLGLASGQDIAKELGDKFGGKRTLTRNDLINGPHGQILIDNNMVEHTPLWYYILLEAQVCGEVGEHLGPVGSYIVARTIVWLIARSNISILREGWKPQCSEPVIAPSDDPTKFTMADLIRFSHTKEQPLIYPPYELSNKLPGE